MAILVNHRDSTSQRHAEDDFGSVVRLHPRSGRASERCQALSLGASETPGLCD